MSDPTDTNCRICGAPAEFGHIPGISCKPRDASGSAWNDELSTLRAQLVAAEAEIERLKVDVLARERIVREGWWRNHGCGNSGYGDDSEMQCCMKDFKRAPFEELKQWVWATRIKNADKKISAHLELKARAVAAEAKNAELEAQRQPSQSVSEERLQKAAREINSRSEYGTPLAKEAILSILRAALEKR